MPNEVHLYAKILFLNKTSAPNTYEPNVPFYSIVPGSCDAGIMLNGQKL